MRVAERAHAQEPGDAAAARRIGLLRLRAQADEFIGEPEFLVQELALAEHVVEDVEALIVFQSVNGAPSVET